MTVQTLPPARQRERPAGRQIDVSGHQEGHIEVRRTRYGSEPQSVLSQKIHVPVFPTSPAFVSVRTKETINTGDYNSVSVEVSISLPCLPEESEIQRVYHLCSDVAESWMNREISRATDPAWENKP